MWIVLAIIAAIIIVAWGLAGVSSGSGGTGSMPSLLAQAVGLAEGVNRAGAIPQRANNPGDLELGDQGLGTINGKTIFATMEDGWTALEHQLGLIVSGSSPVYNQLAQSLGLENSSQLTIAQVAEKYTGGDNSEAWANTVAQQLGATPDTPIGEAAG